MSQAGQTIALVAGEASGELLAVDLIRQLSAQKPEVHFLVVGGHIFKDLDVEIIADNDLFHVMGLVEIISDLPALLKAKNQLVKTLLNKKPDLFIGIDAPELNFAIAKKMHANGIPVVHYVSPSVWAWRPKRVYKMARYIDYLLTLFPFEPALYTDTSIKTYFVGHPLAHQIPVEVNKNQCKKNIGLNPELFTFALMPGSRGREIETLMPYFAATVQQLAESDWQIVSSSVSPEKQQLADSIAAKYGVKIFWFDDSQDALKASDFALVGSGTVALEAMLCKTPMVVAYKIAAMSYHIVRIFKLMQQPYYSLPNVLFGDFLIPEVMQNDLTVEQLVLTTQQNLQDKSRHNVVIEFSRLHQQLLAPKDKEVGDVLSTILEEL